jgi:hypothetical protein
MLLLVLLAASAAAQVTDAAHMGGPVALSTWRIQGGDDARWSATDFDDSSWRVIPADKQWDELGIGNLRGYLWFRTRVLIPENSGPLGLAMSLIGPHEIFANGKRIGAAGEFPPRGLLYEQAPRFYRFDTPKSRSVELAIRLWLWPKLNRVGRAPGTVFIGPVEAMRLAYELMLRRILGDQIASYVLQILYTVLVGGLIVLFILQRKQSEYLWLSLAILPVVLTGIVDNGAAMIGSDVRWKDYFDAVGSVISAVCLLEFVFRFLREATPTWVRIYQFAFALNLLSAYAAWHGWISIPNSNLIHLLLYTPFWFAIPAIVLWRFIRGNKEAGLLAIPLFLMFGIDMSNSLHWVLWLLRIRQTATPFFPT